AALGLPLRQDAHLRDERPHRPQAPRLARRPSVVLRALGPRRHLVPDLHGEVPADVLMRPLVVPAGAPVELLERESGLAFLARSLEEVRDEGHGRVALVTGEAGVGKTALL